MILTGKTALVTGGSRGIGRAVVRRLVRDGARVVFTYHAADQAAATLADETGAEAVRCDQADLTTLPAIFAPVRDGLDILVNNAGVTDPGPIESLTPAVFDRVMTINAKFPLFAIQAAIPLLRSPGRIINISTLNTAIPGPGLAMYCASKAALEQFTAVAARELGPRSITVNTISPGATDTDLLHATNTPESLSQTAAMTALRRIGSPDDIAGVVAFLTTPDAAWVTGQNIRATGGLLL
ncbi:3-oxoacyl-[acyl-carrier protein] reductase [Actinoplanes lutulentus]|uniref:3-oxoacyl-[acyl-carrier protein] reductase n=1 Tax=Actinoplanes lutulentus TaxID=1287878 RepID=A0A327ZAD0_9ACTN|nr:SDR family oxidoreductase [Actinoplanes lutulentus]MBB2942451.1 3-oxoacyl-[acyl-carrier protein] reductase [Actinoplanes lutulentus]RAK33221.1 3-oxoacyl-[acyl-carrier protein] reductase [Actinoplanes lutulentus]